MSKKIRITMLIFFILIIIAAITLFCISRNVENVGSQYLRNADEVEPGDAIIVLGAYVAPDGTLSDMLEDRLKVGIELYKNKKAPKIIVSGDHGRKEYDEVNAMRDYLIKNGVPDTDIFMDHAGFNTYDSIYRARDVFLVQHPIIVTQEFHAVRAAYIARCLGFEPQCVTSDLQYYSSIRYSQLREYPARIKAFFQAGVFKPNPKFLGEAIPVSGDGNVTADKGTLK
ncbi:MAG: ElyC/SanA/YdcF family protein [Bacillota bacterium]|nr:ElyC/SanA/YdcF family protein [Bacillota bacterium]